MVTTGHYFAGIFWIPTTFALFVFAFSSGYFTSRKYHHPFSKGKFWYAKIVRLWYSILIIDIFLFVLFTIQQKDGIYTWQTLPSLIGVCGFLSWFKLGNPSPFGSGLWFFTLLLLFYLFYPLLSLLNKKCSIAFAFLLISLILTTFLYYTVPMNHMLWMTVFAFILGSYSGEHESNIPLWFCVSFMTASCLVMMFLNIVYDFNLFNYVFILIASVSIIGFLLNKRLPKLALNKVLLLSGCVIQIYFIHPYIFIKTLFRQPAINYVISLFVVITIAFFLSKISDKLSSVSLKRMQSDGSAKG